VAIDPESLEAVAAVVLDEPADEVAFARLA
jgi:hypothetical protein